MKTKLKSVASSPRTGFKIINKNLNNFIMSTFNYKSSDLEVQNGKLVWLNEKCKRLTLPEGTETVDVYAFQNLKVLPELLSVPNSFKDMGIIQALLLEGVGHDTLLINKHIVPEYLAMHTDIKNVCLLDNVRVVEKAAFAECKKLETLYLTTPWVKVEMAAFAACPKLEAVIVKGVLDFDRNTFRDSGKINVIPGPDSTGAVSIWASGDKNLKIHHDVKVRQIF